MSSFTYLGNCSSIIDWDSIITSIENKQPDRIGPPDMREGLEDIKECWEKAGYKHTRYGGSVEWSMYFADTSFDRKIVDNIIKFFDIPHYNDCWISRVMPGHCAAPHVDAMHSDKKVYRMHIYPQDSQMGHVFYAGDEYITNYKKGDAYLWNDPKAWHGGLNCGLTPKYMFNLY